ncbi:hypothetical protein QYE76_039397 [Lolium multiflorum]|uniref:Cytochrome P450 n=1 Tax=Lolium multiflorum TaxID=4521 RepID=A0AAD8T9L5_LOLMU|nr:hypothetical protein QYE76_039397 [Lolium multiflorum]
MESEITHGDIYEFTVPIFGKEMGFAVDYTTRMEQNRFFVESLRPAQLRNHVNPMLQEVEDGGVVWRRGGIDGRPGMVNAMISFEDGVEEDGGSNFYGVCVGNYFAKWGDEGIVDLKHEFQQLLMLISSRCLVGKEVREKMFGQFCTLLHQIEEGLNLVSFLFPYIPIPVNRRRDKARIKLTGLLSEIVMSRKSFDRVEEDVLQRLMDSTYKDGRATTLGEVSGLILGLIFAGKHTSATTITWTGAQLLSHQKFLVAAMDEQKQIIGKYKENIDYSVLSEMRTLHSCIKEAARMHPALPTLVRKVQKDITVTSKGGNEYGIPKGNTLVNLVLVNGMLPHIYNDPEV